MFILFVFMNSIFLYNQLWSKYKMKQYKNKLAAMAAASLLTLSVPAQAIPVATELFLLVDVSGSIDANEYNLQKSGYVQAFQNPAIQAQIAALPGGIAVAYAEWSGGNSQSLEVGWTQITDAASANAFASAISSADRDFSGSTAPGSAINWAVPQFVNNFEGQRQVIDVSGDGTQNDGANTSAARDAALAGDIDAINGLAIGSASLETWYQNNVQGGAGSFTVRAATFNDFSTAVANKIQREITGVPVPATLSLLALGLLGFGFARNKK